MHRVLAARKAGLTEILAEVRQGTLRDARLFGISANSDHGLPRFDADKRKAVALLLADPEWSHGAIEKLAGAASWDTRPWDACAEGYLVHWTR